MSVLETKQDYYLSEEEKAHFKAILPILIKMPVDKLTPKEKQFLSGYADEKITEWSNNYLGTLFKGIPLPEVKDTPTIKDDTIKKIQRASTKVIDYDIAKGDIPAKLLRDIDPGFGANDLEAKRLKEELYLISRAKVYLKFDDDNILSIDGIKESLAHLNTIKVPSSFGDHDGEFTQYVKDNLRHIIRYCYYVLMNLPEGSEYLGALLNSDSCPLTNYKSPYARLGLYEGALALLNDYHISQNRDSLSDTMFISSVVTYMEYARDNECNSLGCKVCPYQNVCHSIKDSPNFPESKFFQKLYTYTLLIRGHYKAVKSIIKYIQEGADF